MTTYTNSQPLPSEVKQILDFVNAGHCVTVTTFFNDAVQERIQRALGPASMSRQSTSTESSLKKAMREVLRQSPDSMQSE